MARYSPSGVPTSPELDQTQRWLREETEQIRASTDDIYAALQFSIDTFVLAAYGGIGLDAVTPISNVDATWQTLPFDVETLPEPQGVTYTLGSNALRFDVEGVWRINAKVSLEFTEANQGRRIQLRLLNLTAGTPSGTVFNFSVGRNTDGANLNFNLAAQVSENEVGDSYVLQVASSSDTFSSVVAIGSIWDVFHVSEYKGDFFDRVEGKRRR